jgi:hypothetical protein
MKAILEFNPSGTREEQREFYCAINGKKYRQIIEEFIRKMHLKHHEQEGSPGSIEPRQARFLIEDLAKDFHVELDSL